MREDDTRLPRATSSTARAPRVFYISRGPKFVRGAPAQAPRSKVRAGWTDSQIFGRFHDESDFATPKQDDRDVHPLRRIKIARNLERVIA